MNAHQTKKTPDIVPNKAREIREAAKWMVAQGKPPSPKKIMIILKESGIKVTSAQVSTALAKTEFAYRKNTAKWDSPRPVLPDPLDAAMDQVTLPDLIAAQELVGKLGSMEKAAAALFALSRLGGKAQKEDLDHQNGTPDEKPEERQAERCKD